MSSQCCAPANKSSSTSCCEPSSACCVQPAAPAPSSSAAPSESEAKSMVAAYYTDLTTGGGTADLKTAACCVAGGIPKHLRKLMSQVADEVTAKFYGCGSPIPPLLEGCTVLDLGCGTGRDCFVLSKLVGPSGSVIGLDMTPAQLEIANKYIDYHTKKWGYDKSNISFRHGFIEDLATAGIADGSVDVVISNCVINLSANKEKVFKEIARVLKPGGELYFSDVFADRRIPKVLQQDAVLLGECLSGALYIEDFRRMLAKVGLNDYRVVSRSVHDLGDPAENAIAAKIGHVTFYSLTLRSFKIAELEDRCEDYGQVAYYKGTIPGMPHCFELDDHHCLKTNYPMPVCSNTALMLSATRYKAHFTVHGDTSTHFGLFDCSAPAPAVSKDAGTKAACC